MKKIIAILAAGALFSAAFAQTVEISSTLSTSPEIYVDGESNQWGFSDEKALQILQKKLTAKGISAVLGGLSLTCGAATGQGSGTPDGLKLTDDLVQKLTASASGYIRGLLK